MLNSAISNSTLCKYLSQVLRMAKRSCKIDKARFCAIPIQQVPFPIENKYKVHIFHLANQYVNLSANKLYFCTNQIGSSQQYLLNIQNSHYQIESYYIPDLSIY